MKQTTTTGTGNAARFSSDGLLLLIIAVCVAAFVVLFAVPFLPVARAEALSLATVAAGVGAFGLSALCDHITK
jgi:hypothetical protein